MAQRKTNSFLLFILTIFAGILLLVNAGRDFYQILGIRRGASDKDIKKAFRKLSLKYHPDQNPSESAKQKYLDINMAYETLSDPEKRKMFDQFGEEGVNQQAQQQQQQGGHNPFGGFPFGGFGGGGGGFEQFFHFGGGGGGGGGQRRQQQQQQQYPAKNIYDGDSNVIELNEGSWPFFRTENDDDKANIWLINFYSDQCSHCHTISSTYKEIAKETRGIIKISAINCAKESKICKQNGIQSYPTFKHYGYFQHSNPTTWSPPNYEKNTFIEYLYKSIPNFIKTETTLSLLEKLNLGQPFLPQIIILTPANRKPLLSPSLITLAKNFKNFFRFFAVISPISDNNINQNNISNDPEWKTLLSFLSQTSSTQIKIDPIKLTKPQFIIRTPTQTTHYTGPASFKELTTTLTTFSTKFKQLGYYSTSYGEFVLQQRGQRLTPDHLLALQNNPSAGYTNIILTCPYIVQELTSFDGFNNEKPLESKFSSLLPRNAEIETWRENQHSNEYGSQDGGGDDSSSTSKKEQQQQQHPTLSSSQIAFILFETLQTTTKPVYFIDIVNDRRMVEILTIMAQKNDPEFVTTMTTNLRTTCQYITNSSTQYNPLPSDINNVVLGLGLNLKRNRMTTLQQNLENQPLTQTDLMTYLSQVETFIEQNESSPSKSKPMKKVKVAMGLEKDIDHDEL